jgi:23S rRNA pseudouridine1911/1915/1917 synthase
LDEFLASRFAALSRIRIANLVEAGACLVNGQKTPPGHRVVEGDFVEIEFEEGPPTAMRPEPIPLEILFEDDHILVLVKPAGMLVHPTRSVKSGTLVNALVYHFNKSFYESSEFENLESHGAKHKAANSELRPPAHGEAHSIVRPGLVHRLDRATSGLMVVAKTARALSRLTIHFRRRLVEKRYTALVVGVVAEDEGVITAPIGRDAGGRPQWRVLEGGKEAVTKFSVRERFRGSTLVELEPVTGRTNQLRIHCAHAGHAILGDELYGPPVADPCPPRLCLHASRLAFYHPGDNRRMEFISPPPRDFASVLDLLRQ